MNCGATISKIILGLSLAAIVCLGLFALAFTPAETRFAFRSCQNYLKMSRAELTRRAERAGFSREEGVGKCHYMIRRGLAQMCTCPRSSLAMNANFVHEQSGLRRKSTESKTGEFTVVKTTVYPDLALLSFEVPNELPTEESSSFLR